jgi:hypothetical protein
MKDQSFHKEMLQGISPYFRTGLAAALLVSSGGEEIAVLGQWFVYLMAVCE